MICQNSNGEGLAGSDSSAREAPARLVRGVAKKNKGGAERSRARKGEKKKSKLPASPLFWDAHGGFIVATQLYRLKPIRDGAPDICSEVDHPPLTVCYHFPLQILISNFGCCSIFSSFFCFFVLPGRACFSGSLTLFHWQLIALPTAEAVIVGFTTNMSLNMDSLDRAEHIARPTCPPVSSLLEHHSVKYLRGTLIRGAGEPWPSLLSLYTVFCNCLV